MTISDLTTSLANPYNFTVTGTSGSQNATVNLTLLFADYTLSASPSLNTIVAGATATYAVVVTPINGFSKQVELACGSGMPPGASCSFSNSTVSPNGGPASSTLTINTTKNGFSPPPPASPPGGFTPYLIGIFVLILLALIELARRRHGLLNSERRKGPAFQISLLVGLLLLESLLAACRPAATTATGSTPGNYTITVTGTLSSNTSVTRSTTINLAVTPNS